MPINSPLKGHTAIAKYIAALIIGSMVLACLLFCIYYLANSRETLLNDYTSAGKACFYHSADFSAHVFNTKTKTTGNIFCIIALPLILLCGYWLYRRDFRGLLRHTGRHFYNARESYGWLLLLLIGAVGYAYYGHLNNELCTDEAFSALNFAEAPLTRLLSYYPVPNNHILFNLLNHFAGQVTNNFILSGRLLASLFYCLLIAGNFFLFRHFTRNNLIAFLCSALLASQFIVWGFAAQARGYSLCYLMGWGSFVAFFFYFFGRAGSRHALTVLVGCNICGIWSVPIFLYLLVFQVMAGLLICLQSGQLHLSFWKALFISVAGIYLVYLPVFCYSGFSSVAGNSYVSGSNDAALIWSQNTGFFRKILAVETFGFLDDIPAVAMCCFLLPLPLILLFRSRLKQLSGLALMYLILCLSLVLMVYSMQQLIVFRALGIHMHLVLMSCLLFIAVLIARIKYRRGAVLTAFTMVAVLALIRMYNYNAEKRHTDLYGQDTDAFMAALKSIPISYPPGTSIWLSDESFMWPYLLTHYRHIDVHHCNFHDQQVLFIYKDDPPLPTPILKHYRLQQEAAGVMIYERTAQ